MRTKPKIILILVCALLVGAILACVTLTILVTVFTNSEPYKYSLRMIENNAEIRDYLGAGYTRKGMITGSINMSGSASGTANISYKLKGKNGVSRVYVEAVKENGLWFYQRLVFYKQSGIAESINLLEENN